MENTRDYSKGESTAHQQDYGDFLMSPQEYAEIEDHPHPYRYELKAGNKSLIYLGFSHSSNPEDPAFEVLKNDIDTLQPDMVMVEGFPAINNRSADELNQFANHYQTEEEFIQHHGESTYAVKLALDRGIEVRSPEPTDLDMINYTLEQGSSREAIFVEQVATLLHQYHRIQIKPSVEEYLKVYFERFKQDWQWDDFDFSYENFQVLYTELLGKPFDLNDKDSFKQLSDPIPWKGREFNIINKAAQLNNEYRDRYIVGEIEKALKDHDKVYIVYGATHSVVQEPALRKMMEDLDHAS